jgi:uncharacterized protein YecE (DUF72 family)
MPPGRVFVGISGYDYAGWRGRFYPREHPRRKWLEYASSLFNSIELNGTFYSLKSPDVFRRWARSKHRLAGSSSRSREAASSPTTSS